MELLCDIVVYDLKKKSERICPNDAETSLVVLLRQRGEGLLLWYYMYYSKPGARCRFTFLDHITLMSLKGVTTTAIRLSLSQLHSF